MQHLKIVVSALLIGQCVFQGEGLPAGDKDHEHLYSLRRAFCCGFGNRKDGDSLTTSGTSTGTIDLGNGITIGVDGTFNGIGPDTESIIQSFVEALSSVSQQSLSKALGLNNRKSEEPVDIANILTQLVLGQSRSPENGAINYETAIVFSEMLVVVPPETIRDLKTVSCLMARTKDLEAQGNIPNPNSLLPKSINKFGGDLDRQSELKWIGMAPKIHRAVNGDAVAAKKIIASVTDGFAGRQGVKDLVVEDVHLVIDQVVTFAQLIRDKYLKNK